MDILKQAKQYVTNISKSGMNIYTCIDIGDPDFWIPSEMLEELLNDSLVGISLENLPLRTRSKVAKVAVCTALGYPVPTSFKKTQPRFPGQNFDTYVQKSNNLQIWNEEIAPGRRYVIIRVSECDQITKVRVVTGADLASLDATGTLTHKHQAQLKTNCVKSELISEIDTVALHPYVLDKPNLANITSPIETYYPQEGLIAELNTLSSSRYILDKPNFSNLVSPIDYPKLGELLSIKSLYDSLKSLVGTSFEDTGFDQERNRGAILHRLICNVLGYSTFRDNGQFPDIRHQLLEVKLQTSPTIDLGALKPNDTSPLDIPKIGECQVSPSDVRYAIFYAVIENGQVRLTNFYITTGEDFFSRFPQLMGNEVNAKLQMIIPKDFFN